MIDVCGFASRIFFGFWILFLLKILNFGFLLNEAFLVLVWFGKEKRENENGFWVCGYNYSSHFIVFL